MRTLGTCQSEAAPAIFIAIVKQGPASSGSRRLWVLTDLAGPEPAPKPCGAPPGASGSSPAARLLLRWDGLVDEPGAPPFQATCTLPEAMSHPGIGRRASVGDARLGSTVAEIGLTGAMLTGHRAGLEGARLEPERSEYNHRWR